MAIQIGPIKMLPDAETRELDCVEHQYVGRAISIFLFQHREKQRS